MNTQSAQPSPLFARVRKALTGGIVALVAGALLATGMTSVATAATGDDAAITVTVTTGEAVVANADVSVYEIQNGDYAWFQGNNFTDETGKVTFDGLQQGLQYAVKVKSTEGSFTGGYLAGSSTALLSDFNLAQATVLTKASTSLTATLNQGATVAGTINNPSDELWDGAESVTAYRYSPAIAGEGHTWDLEGNGWTNNGEELSSAFELGNLRPGQYVFAYSQYSNTDWVGTVYGDGYTTISSAPTETITVGGENTTIGSFVGATTLTGSVTFPEGFEYTEGVHVKVTSVDSSGAIDDSQSTYLGAPVATNGSYSISGIGAADYKVQVYTDEEEIDGVYGEWYNNKASARTASIVTVGSTPVTLDPIELGTGFTLSGHVTEGGTPLAGVVVEAAPRSTGPILDATTDASGFFSFPGIAPDDYDIVYDHPNDQVDAYYYNGEPNGTNDWRESTPLAGVDGNVTADLDFPGVASVVATVLSPKGVAVKGAYVMAVPVKGGAQDYNLDSMTLLPVSGKTGVYSGVLETGSDYTLYVSSGTTTYAQYLGGAVADAEGSIANATTFSPENGVNAITVALAAPGTITGVVKSTAKKVIKGVGVTAFQWNGTDWVTSGYGYTNAKGAYSVPVQPGSYKIGFDTYQSPSNGFASNFNISTGDVSSLAPVYVGKGASVIANGTLASAGTISGVVANGAGVVKRDVAVLPIKLEGTPGDWTSRTPYYAGYGYSNAKGAFTAISLPAGYYALSYYDNNQLLGDTYSPSGEVAYYKVTAGKATAAGKVLLPAIAVTDTVTVTGTVSPATSDVEGWVSLSSADEVHFYNAEMNSSGAFSVNVAPGDYTWEARFESDTAGEFAAQRGTFTASEEAVTLVVQAESKTALTFTQRPSIQNWDGPVAGPQRVGRPLVAVADWNFGRAAQSYQWLRDGIPIFGATSYTFSPGGGDLGKTISVRMTLNNRFSPYSAAYQSAVDYSDGVTIISGGQVENDGSPEVSGNTVTPGSVLTSSGGYFYPSPATRTYEWLVDGAVVAGATSKTYTIRTSDIGLEIQSRVSAQRAGFDDSEAVLSYNSVTAEIGKAPTQVKKPTVKATKVGANTKYTVTPGTFSLAGTTASYTWYLDGQTIEGRSSAAETFSLVQAPAASAITVGVTASKQFYAPSTETVVVARKGTAKTSGEAGVTAGEGSISADSQVVIGSTLTATGSYGAPDGSDAVPTYQWQRKTGTKWAAIAKATGSSYKVALADAGKSLQLVVTVASTRYATSTIVVPAGIGTLDLALEVTAVNFDGEIGGTGAVSSTITAPIIEWPVAGVKTTYQWVTFGESTVTPIKGATKSTLVVPATGAGKQFAVAITGTKAGYKTATAYLAPISGNATAITPLSQLGVIGATEADGPLMVKVGTKLTAKPMTVDVTGVTRSYQWALKFPDVELLQEIPGATKTTYTVTAADAATDGASLVLLEDITKANFPNLSAGTDPISILRIPATVKTAPKVTKIASAYTVTPGIYTPAGGETTYDWYINGELSDTTTASYTPGDDQLTALIEVRVTYNVTGYTESDIVLVAQKTAPPVMTEVEQSQPRALEGSYVDFESTGSFSGSDYSWQWYLGTTAIKGATSVSYTPTIAQVGKKLKWTVTLNSPKTTKVTLTSTPQTVLAAYGPDNGTAVSTGYAMVGQTIAATVAEKRTGFTTSYVWLRSNDQGGWTPIAGATKLSYKLAAADLNNYVAIRTTYKRTGYETTVYDSYSWLVGGTYLENLTAPTITGSGAVGVPLTATPGTWANSPTLSYQWLRNDEEIPGATSSKFTPTGDFYGDDISVRVDANKSGAYRNDAYSAPIAVTKGAAPTIVGTATPKLTGSGLTCSTFTATEGTWSLDGVSVKFQWYRIDGSSKQLIAGATKSTYTATAGDAGIQLKVIVTAERPGYTTGISETGTTAALAQNCEL